jgi:hypothetical protein
LLDIQHSSRHGKTVASFYSLHQAKLMHTVGVSAISPSFRQYEA